MRTAVSLFVGCLLLAGCSGKSTSAALTRVPGISFEPLPIDHIVTIYATEVPESMTGIINLDLMPDGGVTLGRVIAKGNKPASWDDVAEAAKQKARTIGGDCIVIEDWRHDERSVYAASETLIVPIDIVFKVLEGRVMRFQPMLDARLPREAPVPAATQVAAVVDEVTPCPSNRPTRTMVTPSPDDRLAGLPKRLGLSGATRQRHRMPSY